MLDIFSTVKFSQINLLNLVFSIIGLILKNLHLYFRDMGLNLYDLSDWKSINTIQLLVLKCR